MKSNLNHIVPPCSPSLVVVTLWRPGWTSVQSQVLDWLSSEPWPEGTHFFWSADAEGTTTAELESGLEKFPPEFTFELLEAPSAGVLTNLQKHLLVASLYGDIVSRLETELVLFVEDDNIPARGAYGMLQKSLDATGSDTAAVMGAYRSRLRPDAICASSARGSYFPWGTVAASALLEADWIGGGFTLYRSAALKACVPFNPEIKKNSIAGWDVILCRKLRKTGARLLVDCSIRVAHACPEVLSYCETTGEPIC